MYHGNNNGIDDVNKAKKACGCASCDALTLDEQVRVARTILKMQENRLLAAQGQPDGYYSQQVRHSREVREQRWDEYLKAWQAYRQAIVDANKEVG